MFRKYVLTVVVLMTLAPVCFAAGAAAHRVYRAHGFSIAPPELPRGAGSTQVVTMYLPASQKFAPNVNVQRQRYPGTMAQYVAMSNQQFSKFDLTVIEHEADDRSASWEYRGVMQGQELHFYAEAWKSGDFVFLATGTSLQSQWKQVGGELTRCVQSFELDGP